jgi:hypothetical protein
MKINIKKYRYEKIADSNLVEVDLPTETAYFYIPEINCSIKMVPRFKSKIYPNRYRIITVQQASLGNDIDRIEDIFINVKDFEDIYNSNEHPYGFIIRQFIDKRLFKNDKEFFEEKFNKAVEYFKS